MPIMYKQNRNTSLHYAILVINHCDFVLQVKCLALKIENKTLLQSVNIYAELLQVRHPFEDPFEGGLP